MSTNPLNIKTLSLSTIFGEWPMWEASIPVDQLLVTAQEISENSGELLTLWGSDERNNRSCFCLHLVFIFWEQGVLYIHCDLPEHAPAYPDLSTLFPIANRLQRTLFDLLGLKALGSDDQRPWLRHNAWPSDVFPLRNEISLTDRFPLEADRYSFVQVGGEGVHEIPVGPVHAGIIEPGHFRFHVVGEQILRLEERLGYTHKGIAKHFQNALFHKGAKLAGRISGDSTVAYAWAYSMALENLHQQTVPPRAQWLRALFLERERIANHLGDLGALGNDAGLSFSLNQFSRLKEEVLRINDRLFKHRYLMDIITPGGVCVDVTPANIIDLQQEIKMLQLEIEELRNIYSAHEGLQDRFVSAGIINPELARQLAIVGLAGRASDRQVDWRRNMKFSPYNQMDFNICRATSGDVAARVLVRFNEITESLRLLEVLLKNLPEGVVKIELPKMTTSEIGIGCVEGWRGPIFFAVCNEDSEHVRWAHMHDPSWQNWPALEHAVIGNIVPDFPLINKSFNLSYSGHDS